MKAEKDARIQYSANYEGSEDFIYESIASLQRPLRLVGRNRRDRDILKQTRASGSGQGIRVSSLSISTSTNRLDSKICNTMNLLSYYPRQVNIWACCSTCLIWEASSGVTQYFLRHRTTLDWWRRRELFSLLSTMSWSVSALAVAGEKSKVSTLELLVPLCGCRWVALLCAGQDLESSLSVSLLSSLHPRFLLINCFGSWWFNMANSIDGKDCMVSPLHRLSILLQNIILISDSRYQNGSYS